MTGKVISGKKETYLSFRIGEETFAINVFKVLEVLEIQKITKIPNMPFYMKGVINFRDEVLPVVDTRLKFGLEALEFNANIIIIVIDLRLDEKSLLIGAIVDSVKDVIEIAVAGIQPIPELNSSLNSGFINGLLRTDPGFIIILNFEQIFSLEELKVVEAVKKINEALLSGAENQ